MSKTKYHFVSNTGHHTAAAAGGGVGVEEEQVAEREQADERAAQPQRSVKTAATCSHAPSQSCSLDICGCFFVYQSIHGC